MKIRGDKAHPASRGYMCEKAQRLDHYQNGVDRVTHPQRRRADGTFETISWESDYFGAISHTIGRWSKKPASWTAGCPGVTPAAQQSPSKASAATWSMLRMPP